jgi:hypothetical protein
VKKQNLDTFFSKNMKNVKKRGNGRLKIDKMAIFFLKKKRTAGACRNRQRRPRAQVSRQEPVGTCLNGTKLVPLDREFLSGQNGVYFAEFDRLLS